MSPLVTSARVEPPRIDPLERTRRLVGALRSPQCYFHPAADIEVIETHISYVILAGPFAYKLKKPVKLHFLDYSTLQARRHYCEEEARLNARTAPELYLGVVPVAGSLDRPIMGGTGEAIEYAVRMRRFPEEARLERLAASDRLEARHVDALAGEIVRLHEEARRSGGGVEFGSPDEVQRCALDNFRTIQMLEDSSGKSPIPRRLHDWTLAEHAAIRPVIQERQLSGYVRECHGDLHLGNVVLLETGPVIFDCIEFNAGFRWIDVMNDLAFTVMDLQCHGYGDLAARLLNGYLERTDDYGGLRVLRFYMVYRAMVRAKVACIRMHQPGLGDAERLQLRDAFEQYLRLATRLAQSAAPALIFMHGLSGSGKSTVSARLAELLGAVRLRSDVMRKRLYGYPAGARTYSPVGGGLYTRAASERTYLELATRALRVLEAGYPVIIDAAFLERGQRGRFRDLAASHHARFAIVDCLAPVETLRERLAGRAREGLDASEADVSVLEAQLAAHEPLDFAEAETRFVCDTAARGATELTAELLARHLCAKEPRCGTSTSSTATPTASARCTN